METWISYIQYGQTASQKFNEETEYWHNTVNQLWLINVYKALHSTTVEYKFFSSVHGTFSRSGHILGHKIRIYLKLVTIQSMLSDYGVVKLKIMTGGNLGHSERYGN